LLQKRGFNGRRSALAVVSARSQVERVPAPDPGRERTRPSRRAALSAVAWEGKRIYVVDDEIVILKSMRTLLGVWGMESLTANSSAAAQLLFAQHGVPDLMIVDRDLGEGEHGSFAVAGFTTLQKPIAPDMLRLAIAAAVTSAGRSGKH
jgi:hypothetical protein